jgi:glutamate synthase (NADPH/NADH) small chain
MYDYKEYLKEERNQEWRVEQRKSIKAKERTDRLRVHMPEADPKKRNKNSEEVNKGLDPQQAVFEAGRCLDCANPTCINGCPVGINIPKFIKQIEAGFFNKAASTLKETNALPAVCGRVCPQEKQCEASCFYTEKRSCCNRTP